MASLTGNATPIITLMKTQSSSLNQGTERITTTINQVGVNLGLTEEAVRQSTARLIDAIHKREQELITEARGVAARKTATLRTQLAAVEATVVQLTGAIAMGEYALASGNPVCMQRTLKDLRVVSTLAKPFAGTAETEILTFVFGDEAKLIGDLSRWGFIRA